MYELNEAPAPRTWPSVLGLFVSGFALIFMTGVGIGFLNAHQDAGGGGSTKFWLVVIGVLIAVGAALLSTMHYARKIWSNAASGPLTKRERRNRIVTMACLLVGGLTGVAMAINDNDPSPRLGLFSDSPISPTLAIILAIFLGIIMPAIMVYWYRHAVDEQEIAAYKEGGYIAATAYIVILPIWWFLWRGGLMPAINGIAVYFTFNFVWLGVWMWKKYR